MVVNEKVGELFLEGVDLGAIANHDVLVVGVVEGIILVVVLCVIEAFERVQLVRNGFGEDVCSVELGDIGCGYPNQPNTELTDAGRAML